MIFTNKLEKVPLSPSEATGFLRIWLGRGGKYPMPVMPPEKREYCGFGKGTNDSRHQLLPLKILELIFVHLELNSYFPY